MEPNGDTKKSESDTDPELPEDEPIHYDLAKDGTITVVPEVVMRPAEGEDDGVSEGEDDGASTDAYAEDPEPQVRKSSRQAKAQTAIVASAESSVESEIEAKATAPANASSFFISSAGSSKSLFSFTTHL